MKRFVWLTAMVVGGVSLCSAQDLTKTDEGTGPELTQEAPPWRISGGLVYKNWLYEHDALQQRAPSTSKRANDWELGDTDGKGSGLRAKIGRGDGCLNVDFMKSDFTYTLVVPGGLNEIETTAHPGGRNEIETTTRSGGRHEIETTSRDFEASWSQIRGRNEQSEWGSLLGFRYLGMQKSVLIQDGSKTVSGPGNMNWLMLLGGYNGNWRPFLTPMFQAHGSMLFLLGEVEGNARSGEDLNWGDGVSETYPEESSMAYGARASFGVDIAITKRVRLTVDYMREWLYSFDSTDTGIVVFPDNSDALFIENHHALVASVNYLF